MNKLKKEELLEWLDSFKNVYLNACKITTTEKLLGLQIEQACKQIKEMIQKPEVTEEWIDNFVEEKARKLHEKCIYSTRGISYTASLSMEDARDFIRLLVGEIK